MAYDKAKVTIDLEEYQELLNKKDAPKEDEYMEMAKTVIATIVNSRNNTESAMADLKRAGILFYISRALASDNYTIRPDQIIIQKIKQ